MLTRLQRTIKNKEAGLNPIWLMRQAGRYMPEYMAIKNNSKGFLDMALTPSKATEITLQPIEAFDMDAAIIFSDILIIPHALGQELDYTPGPVLGKLDYRIFETNIDDFLHRCKPVYDAIAKTRQQLDDSKSLIGFAGAPWTLYRYMSGIHSTLQLDHSQAQYVMERLTVYVIQHLVEQIRAGCDTVQIFDSWASDIHISLLVPYCFNPTAKIVDYIRKYYPDVGIIAFPRLLDKEIKTFSSWVKPDCINLSNDVPLEWCIDNIDICLQGGIDPNVLITNNHQPVKSITEHYINEMQHRAYVVNLAHAVNKETPVQSVQAMVDTVKENRI